ncbi:MAG TPA: AI-2E family transporter [Candidatus Tectomicrobia bacterium]|nr:AI-2E family transporter [Candidatus Tectomicrobia bacterium]
MASSMRKLPLLYILSCFVLVIACLYWAKSVLIPVALAVMLTFLLNPVVRFLQRRGLPRTPAVLLVVALAFSVLGGVGWMVTRQLTALAYELPRYQENLKQKMSDLRELGKGGIIERLQTTLKEVTGELQKATPPPPEIQPVQEPTEKPTADPEKPIPVVVQAPSMFWQLPVLMEPLASAGLVIVLVIFMLIQYADLRSRLIRLAGYGHSTVATKALDEAGQRISRYLLMQAIINGSFGLAVGVGLFLIGVPYAILWGFLSAVLRFIPYVGPVVSAFFPSALSLAVFPGWGQPIMVISLILVLELASNMVMEPLLYGQSAGVSEVALLVAVAFWTWLWGPVGLFLATPMTVCLGVLGKYIPQMEFMGVLLSDEPAMEASTDYYQRLVARDQDEAAALAEAYLNTHTLAEAYDELLIPALNSAKRDRDLETLTEEDVQFIVQATREIVEDLALHQAEPAPSSSAAAPMRASTVNQPARISGCPAHDEADELALLMLRQLLDPTRYSLQVISAEMLTAEVLSAVEEQHVGLICIASLPPGALAPTRYLCKRLRARFPGCKIVVGRWGLREDWDKPQALLREAGADEVGMTLQETSNQVMQLSQLLPTCEPQPSSPSTATPSLPEDKAASL